MQLLCTCRITIRRNIHKLMKLEKKQRKVKDLKLETLMPAKDGLIIFRERFGLKNIKTGNEASANRGS